MFDSRAGSISRKYYGKVLSTSSQVRPHQALSKHTSETLDVLERPGSECLIIVRPARYHVVMDQLSYLRTDTISRRFYENIVATSTQASLTRHPLEHASETLDVPERPGSGWLSIVRLARYHAVM